MPNAVTGLHEERLDTVTEVLLQSGARSVLDLGCGSGRLLRRLAAEEQFTRIVGLDTSVEALRMAEDSLKKAQSSAGRISLIHGSITAPDVRLPEFDAAVMVEIIEHVPPELLSLVERTVFADWRPALVVVTTPNREYNVLYGLQEGEYRHPDHHFEWCRAKFRRWASGIAARNGYDVQCGAIGPSDALLGSPTQIGLLRRKSG